MITIKAWKKDIAQLVEYKGVIKFKYLDSNNLDFSPIKMPIKNRQVYNFSHIDFQYGLPGLISDCLPGSYGMNYLDRFMFQYLKRKLTIFERLQFLGTHTLGALEFHPSLEAEEYKEVLNISKVYEESKKILNQENEKENNSILTLKTLIAVSNSAGGGARSKAIVGFNPKDKTISLTRKQGDFPKDYYPVIIKYDEQDISMYPTLSNKYKDTSIATKLEYLYYLFAKESGVNISPCELLEQEGRTHFLTYRFDLKDNERFHIHSLSGMMHYNPAETYNDFIDMFRISLKLNLSQKDKEEVVKVILFNAIFGNKDDHSKNFSFLMNSQGKWSFAPAYDLTYTSNRYHQMLLGNKVLNRALFEDLKNAFEPYNIKESFLKENIEKMIDIKHKKLVQEFINYDIPKNLANHILNETKIVDENFSKEIKK
ncbi:type II toxin-antitoxin system HipA family toxin [Aliarcobacter cryaerophilus]|uniref:type II toxin-antitoxin system HipA family toxin n=1 Tax=Aliarcobacter cryaerophilus TaxID=28198 RepID=UPI003DA69260